MTDGPVCAVEFAIDTSPETFPMIGTTGLRVAKTQAMLDGEELHPPYSFYFRRLPDNRIEIVAVECGDY